MLIRRIQVLFILLCLCLQGCSDINDGKAEATSPGNGSDFPNCEVSSSNFELLLEKPIRSDIECAYDKINWLVNNVREEEEKKGNNILSKENLKLSIENREPEARKVLEYLDLFFDLNRFVVGSDENLIIEDDFKALRDFLVVMNREFSKIYKHFAPEIRDNETLYNIHYNSLNEILSILRYIMLEAKSESGDDISLKGLLSRHKEIKREINLSKLFDLLKLDKEAKSWLFLKRLMMGGDANVITNDEFLNFLERTVTTKNKKPRIENKVLQVVEVGYNLYRQLKLRFDSPQKRYSFQNANYSLAKKLVYKKCIRNCRSKNESSRAYKEESLVTLSDLMKWANYFFDDDLSFSGNKINLLNYDWEIARLKEIFLGNNSQEITYRDIDKLFNILTEFTDIGEDFSELFKANQDLMLDKTKRITKRTPLKKPALVDNGNGKKKSRLKSHKNQKLFKDVLTTFRYFKGAERMPIYDNQYHRNNKSIIIYGQLEFLLRKFARFYEKEYPCHKKGVYYVYNFEAGKRLPEQLFHDYYCSTGWRPRKEDYAGNIDLGQLYFIILEFRQLFREIGIIDKGAEDSSAENALTIPDLFIYAANDDGVIQVSELIEFFFSIFSAVEIKDDILAELQRNPFKTFSNDSFFTQTECRVVDNTEKGERRYDALCIRENFYKFLEMKNRNTGKKYGPDRHFDYLTLLKDFFINNRYEEDQKALRRYTLLLEGYTKSCPYDNVPYTGSDLMALYTGMYSIESTMGKFDLNGDNVLGKAIVNGKEVHELELAYENHFKPGLWAIVREKLDGIAEDQKKLKKYDPNKDYSLVKEVFQYLATYGEVPEIKWGNLAKGIKIWFKGYPTVGRAGIASILVALQDLTESARIERYRRAGKKYVSPEKKCIDEELPAGEKRLIRTQWACYIEGNCP